MSDEDIAKLPPILHQTPLALDLLDARARITLLERVAEAARPCAQLLPGPNGRALNRALAALSEHTEATE